MTWDKTSWNRHLRTTRSALVKRDALAEGAPSGNTREQERERREIGRAHV